MREILFKGKKFYGGDWIEGFFWKDDLDDEDSWFISNNGTDYPIIPSTVSEYTGLNDKNNKKIYEWDIVKLSYVDRVDDELLAEWLAVVEFGNPNGEYNWGFQLRPISKSKGNTDILLWIDMEEVGAYCEVIGNIFDNPEILKR